MKRTKLQTQKRTKNSTTTSQTRGTKIIVFISNIAPARRKKKRIQKISMAIDGMHLQN